VQTGPKPYRGARRRKHRQKRGLTRLSLQPRSRSDDALHHPMARGKMQGSEKKKCASVGLESEDR